MSLREVTAAENTIFRGASLIEIVCWLHFCKWKVSNTFFWSPPFSAPLGLFSPTTLWHTQGFFFFFNHSLIKKSRGKKRALLGICGSNLRSAAELSSFASRLHKRTESCTLEQRASRQSAVSGLPWCSSSSVHLPHNEGWLATRCTVFLHTVVIRCNNNHKKSLNKKSTRIWGRHWKLLLASLVLRFF